MRVILKVVKEMMLADIRVDKKSVTGYTEKVLNTLDFKNIFVKSVSNVSLNFTLYELISS